MPNSFTQIHYHIVFSVKDRFPCLQGEKRELIYAYLVGLFKKQNCYVLRINGGYDHVHILVHAHPSIALEELMKFVKANCSHWINKEQLFNGKFYWQAGYGGFSVSPSQIDSVKAYIDNQEEHHKRFSFQEEFKKLLEKHGIAYDEKYLP